MGTHLRINRETWYREALSSQWDDFESLFEKGQLEESRYGEWLNLALRTDRLKEIPYQIVGVMTRLDPKMSPEEILGAWRLALNFTRIPDGLTLGMLKKSEKAGVDIHAVCWIGSDAYVPGYDGGHSLQYNGPVAPDLKTYSHSANQYHDLKYQLVQSPEKLLNRLKRLGWSYSEDQGVHHEREFAPGRFPGRRQISEWAQREPVSEELTLYFNELRIYLGGKSYTIPPGRVAYWYLWVKEVFGAAASSDT